MTHKVKQSEAKGRERKGRRGSRKKPAKIYFVNQRHFKPEKKKSNIYHTIPYPPHPKSNFSSSSPPLFQTINLKTRQLDNSAGRREEEGEIRGGPEGREEVTFFRDSMKAFCPAKLLIAAGPWATLRSAPLRSTLTNPSPPQQEHTPPSHPRQAAHPSRPRPALRLRVPGGPCAERNRSSPIRSRRSKIFRELSLLL